MATQAIQTERPHPLVALNNQLASKADQFKMALPSHISPDKFQRTILTAVQNDPELLNADRQSLILACMRAAQDGLLPDKREAALVIFKENKNVNGQWETKLLVQYMPMVYGLRKKILQSGEIADITTNVVYRQEIEAGCFVYEEGTERMLRHKPLLDPNFDPTDDDLACAYSIATFKDGGMSFEVMRASEIRKVQEKSQTGATRTKKGEPRKPSGPWVEWKSEQWRKTVMRRHSKSLPMSGDLLDVEARDDAMAAASTQAALSAPAAAPAALPTRAEVVALASAPAVDAEDTPNETMDAATGEFVPTGNADIDRDAPQATASDDQQAAGDEQPDPVDWSVTYDALLARINNVTAVGYLKRIVNEIPADMPANWQSSLRERAAERDTELRQPKP